MMVPTSIQYVSSDDEAPTDSKPRSHRTPSSAATIRITASAAPTIAKLISSAQKTCHVCGGGGSADPSQLLIECSTCPRAAHPACLELNPALVDWECIRAYDWQCMECKRCSRCHRTQDEDKMMFCDRCDRGFHTYCVGLGDVPSGSWLCTECVGWQEKVRGLSDKYNERRNLAESPGRNALANHFFPGSPSSSSAANLSPAVQAQLKSKLNTTNVKRLSINQLLDENFKRGHYLTSTRTRSII